MSNINRETGSRWSRAELTAAFDRVKNAEHWKNPIDATLPLLSADERAIIHEAVIFFTGSVPVFFDHKRTTRVTAAGYFMTIGS